MVTPVRFSFHDVFFGVASVAVAYILFRFIHNLFLSPLSAIPGPWFAAVSNIWLNVNIIRLRRCKAVHKLFEDYGPVVRVAPNKIVFRDMSTMRAVYSTHKFNKSVYYKSLLT